MRSDLHGYLLLPLIKICILYDIFNGLNNSLVKGQGSAWLSGSREAWLFFQPNAQFCQSLKCITLDKHVGHVKHVFGRVLIAVMAEIIENLGKFGYVFTDYLDHILGIQPYAIVSVPIDLLLGKATDFFVSLIKL